MTNDIVLYFLGLVVLLFIVVFAIMFIGFRRQRAYKGTTNANSPEPTMNTDNRAVDQRLGGGVQAGGVDARGDDLGGNFSKASNRGDTASQ